MCARRWSARTCSSLAHISNLFVRRDHWRVGLAADLHRAALKEARARLQELRLLVAAGQARARRFYEREGWEPASDPFDDPTPGLRDLGQPQANPVDRVRFCRVRALGSPENP
ncbi:MAG: GNAT family N-acetyltransferase [Solirubrobacterales bacterium]|nr:GNAT family N-acetyltransferase [Solirubrobacterales bacterium]